MRCSYLLACIAVCLVAVGCGAARLPPLEVVAEAEGFGLSDLSAGMIPWYMEKMGLQSGKGGKGGKFGEFHYATRFVMRPEVREDFESIFQKYQDKTFDDKGLDMCTLKKTTTDNVMYIAYFEWQSFEDFMKHIETGHTKDLMEFMEDNDIVATLIPLTRIADAREGGKTRVSRHGKGQRDLDSHVHVLARFTIPPSERDGFEKAWMDAAEMTWDEEANHEYSLHKVGVDNMQYWVYGSWDEMGDYLDHHSSDHIIRLRDYVNKKSLMWFETFLRHVGQTEEFGQRHA